MNKEHSSQGSGLSLDFDGVIHSYTSGWQGAEVIPDPPVHGAFDFIREAVKRFDYVYIFSARAESFAAREAMRGWFIKHGLELDIVDKLIITRTKPHAVLYIDDRGWLFMGEFPTFEEIEAFKPWYK